MDNAIHIALPVLAATVVGLRLFGDPDDISGALSAVKGIGSGVAGAGFVICAWLSTSHTGRNFDQANAPLAFCVGGACLAGAAILPLHALNQQLAALVAPFLSLTVLVALCCGSIFHLSNRTSISHSEQPSSPRIETAEDILTARYSLSPRERQVLSQLALGRSAEGIGTNLGISPNTVRSHVSNIYSKLGIRSRDQLADLIMETRRQAAGNHTDSTID